MFGVVPRPLWSRVNPPDDEGRISLGMRLLLIVGPDRTWLVDTGMGDKFNEKLQAIYRCDGCVLPDEALRRAGFDPASVTDVILTHLHFDHGGGSTRKDGSIVFPDARHHVQREQFEWACSPAPKDRASFRADDFMPLQKQGRLELHDGPIALADGIEVIPVHGHTPGMQLVKVSDGETTLLYAADLAPTRTHLRTPYIMAYDNHPLTTIDEKQAHIGRAADEGWIIFFEHDADVAACLVIRTERDFEAGKEVEV